ncbi:interferon lambda-2-like [Microtus oregoni]|uniref:interferon lambda-2-like n=1 Tax=Microtus oregoni TaxID=111838 RepID=UPI001BB1D1D0|nr:interferon lambda-2-like [Microtus oregoni]
MSVGRKVKLMKFMNIENEGVRLGSVHRGHTSFQENAITSALLPVSPDYLLFLASSQVQECPKALQADLALTLEVLENVTDSALGPILHQPLHTLRHIQSQLQACTQSQPTAEPGSQSHRLSRWLHKLQEAQEKETPGCLEVSVTFNLVGLLIRDPECVAAGDQCV